MAVDRDHLRYVVHDELASFQPRLTFALAVCAAIPPNVAIRVRAKVLRFAGVRIGPRTTVFGRLSVIGGPGAAGRLTIGDECLINVGCVLDASGPIEIGDRAGLGQEVLLITGSHHVGPSACRVGGIDPQPVRIGAGAWLGARATVLPGVTIGDGAIVAAGAVVTRDVKPNTLVAGVPARFVRELDDGGDA